MEINSSELLAAIAKIVDDRINPLENQIKSLDSRMGTLESQMSTLDSQVISFREETNKRFDTMQEELSEVHTLAVKTSIFVENDVMTNLKLLHEGHKGILLKVQKIDTLEQDMEEVKSDLQVVKRIVSDHSNKIKNLSIIK